MCNRLTVLKALQSSRKQEINFYNVFRLERVLLRYLGFFGISKQEFIMARDQLHSEEIIDIDALIEVLGLSKYLSICECSKTELQKALVDLPSSVLFEKFLKLLEKADGAAILMASVSDNNVWVLTTRQGILPEKTMSHIYKADGPGADIYMFPAKELNIRLGNKF